MATTRQGMKTTDGFDLSREIEKDNARLVKAVLSALDLIDRCQHALKIAAVCQDCANRASKTLRDGLGDRA